MAGSGSGGVLAVGFAWAVIAALDRGLIGGTPAEVGLPRLLVVAGFGIVGHLIWRLVVERAGDLIQRRHDARVVSSKWRAGVRATSRSSHVGRDRRHVAGETERLTTLRIGASRCRKAFFRRG